MEHKIIDGDAFDFKYNIRQDYSSNFERWQQMNDEIREKSGRGKLSGEEQLNRFQKMYGYIDEN